MGPTNSRPLLRWVALLDGLRMEQSRYGASRRPCRWILPQICSDLTWWWHDECLFDLSFDLYPSASASLWSWKLKSHPMASHGSWFKLIPDHWRSSWVNPLTSWRSPTQSCTWTWTATSLTSTTSAPGSCCLQNRSPSAWKSFVSKVAKWMEYRRSLSSPTRKRSWARMSTWLVVLQAQARLRWSTSLLEACRQKPSCPLTRSAPPSTFLEVNGSEVAILDTAGLCDTDAEANKEFLKVQDLLGERCGCYHQKVPTD